MSIKIKNWEKFQHFKDRKPLWVKLYRDLLDDIEWHLLDPLAAKTLVSLWLLASENDGDLPDIKVIAFRLRQTEKSIKSILTSLNHWLIQVDNNLLSDCYQDDIPHALAERLEETEKEKEKSTRIKRAIQMPDDFAVNENGVSYALDRNLDVNTEFNSFKNWHTAKGTVYKDWQSAWRTWCDKAVEFGRAGNKSGGKKSELPWWSTNELMLAKGKELNTEPRPGEGWNEFKSRMSKLVSDHA